MHNSTVKISQARFIACLGFTLVELMVTIVVLGIVASIAAPSISKQLANQRVKSTTTTLVNVLKGARAESSINKIPVTVSYINGNKSNNMINVEVPYSGPLVSLTVTRPKDWTSFFINSAWALDTPPTDPDSGGNGNGSGNGSGNGIGNGSGIGSGNGNGNGAGNPTESNLVIIATYPYDAKSIVKSSANKITFRPNKTVSTGVTYTICDSNKSATSRQVVVSSVGLISSKLGGVCE